MSSMWNALAETNLLNRVTSLETSRITDEAAITALQAAIAKLQPAPPAAPVLLLNRDLSTGDLSQYTHRDYGLGTDVGGNGSGAGLLNYHADVAGRRAVGMTATPTAHASPAASSDSVYLWDPIMPWGTQGSEWWLRTSFFFPASAALFLPGESPFVPVTGDWNYFLELHKDKTSGPSEVTFDICTDYPVGSSPGLNPRLRMRLAQNEANPTGTYVNTLGQATLAGVGGYATPGPPLLYDHWYEFLLHEKLDPVHGVLEWFVDGQQLYSNLDVPTLFTHPDGSISQVNLTVPNYRLHAAWPSTFFIGPLCIAPDRASALAAF